MSNIIVSEIDNEFKQLQDKAQKVLDGLANDELRAKALASIQDGCNPALALMNSDDPAEQEAGYHLYTHVMNTFIKHGAWIYRPTPFLAPVGDWRHTSI